jgi:hypothetical protein
MASLLSQLKSRVTFERGIAKLQTLKYADLLFSGRDQQVWELVGCLFDPVEAPNDCVRDAIRQEQISRWLQKRIGYEGADPMKLIMSKQVGKACQQLISRGDYYLSLCLSQVGGPSSATNIAGAIPNGIPGRSMDPSVMELIMTQAKEWSASKFINDHHKSMWSLVSGDCEEWSHALSLCENWYCALGLYVWYAFGGVSFTEALKLYKDSEAGPKPDDEGQVDMEFLLMECFAKERPLGSTLNLKGLNDLEDYRLLWILGLYFNLKFPNEIPLDTLSRHLISQLEANAAWQDSLFVACFLGEEFRQVEQKRLLTRWYPFDDHSGSQFSQNGDSAAFIFVTKELGIPAEWVHEARAIQARYRANNKQELIALLDARSFSEAHRVFQRLVPSLILTSAVDNPFTGQVLDCFRSNGWNCEWFDELVRGQYSALETDSLLMKRAVEHIRSRLIMDISSRSIGLLQSWLQ